MTELFIEDKNLDRSLKHYLKLSKLLREQNKLEESIDTLQQAIQLYPNNSEPDCLLGLLYTDTKNKQLAIASYRQAFIKNSSQPVWVYSALAQLLLQEKRLDETIEICQQALALNKTTDVIYRTLAAALAHKGSLKQAIVNYKKAIELEPNQPNWVYLSLAQHIAKEALLFKNLTDLELQEKQSDLQEAIANYQKAIELKSDLSFVVYSQFANLLLKSGNIQEALNVYFQGLQQEEDLFNSYHELDRMLCQFYGSSQELLSQAIDSYLPKDRPNNQKLARTLQSYLEFGFLGKEGRSVNPVNYYLINSKLKIVYCSIPKNACTLFKTMTIEHSEFQESFQDSQLSIHAFLAKNREKIFANFAFCLKDKEYFKFVVLRNPFERLVSAYLDKFAKHLNPESFCHEVIASVDLNLGREFNLERSITFQQFVEYLARTEDDRLNDHWQPQSNFIGSVKFDFIGQFENLNSTIDLLQDKFQIQIEKKVSSHITNYQEFDRTLEFHNMYPSELRQLPGMPKAAQLYTPELKQIVRERYAEDIEIYEREFQTTI